MCPTTWTARLGTNQYLGNFKEGRFLPASAGLPLNRTDPIQNVDGQPTLEFGNRRPGTPVRTHFFIEALLGLLHPGDGFPEFLGVRDRDACKFRGQDRIGAVRVGELSAGLFSGRLGPRALAEMGPNLENADGG